MEVRPVQITDIRGIPGSPGSPGSPGGVTFTGPAGQAWGLWHGEPPPGGASHVEIDISEPVTTWQPEDSPDVLAGEPLSELTVCARVESVDEDGVVALRLASDIVHPPRDLVGDPNAVEGFYSAYPSDGRPLMIMATHGYDYHGRIDLETGEIVDTNIWR